MIYRAQLGEMAKARIWCPYCKRYVGMKQKDYKIYCPECGEEITYSEKNISPPQQETFTGHPDSKSEGI